MVGVHPDECLPAEARKHDRYRALDHAEPCVRERTLTAGANDAVRGHESHHSSADVAPDARSAFDRFVDVL